MRQSLTLILMAGLLTLSPLFAAGVEIVTVDAEGVGKNRVEAVTAALAEAVGKVNGVKLSTQQIAQLRMAITTEEQTGGSQRREEIELNESTQRQIATDIRGQIKSYEVLAARETAPQNWEAVLQVSVARYAASAQTERRRIAVAPLRVAITDARAEKFAELLAQAINDYLTQTRRFAVLDRAYAAEIQKEVARWKNDDTVEIEKAKLGNAITADYLFVGALDSFGAEKEKAAASGDAYDDWLDSDKNKIRRLTAQVNWRLIEVATGQAVLSQTFADEQTLANRKEGDAAARDLAKKIAAQIGAQIMDTIYPPMAVAFGEGVITVGQGGGTMKIGQRFNLLRYGEILRDPYTNEPIGREETPVAEVEITAVLPKSATAKVVVGDLAAEKFEPKKFILRALAK
ncbi:hypothetical protein FACS1894139_05890 [Planctomycetales bacterium]|nr:hypothetical protein FACS1894107_05290 [Planctomycetales bacterium]GHS97599.1 hypothetical protein FACS1894108_04260 [Planctomycetales bacterium]GHT04176.1 hypothetical protein FACS1894139_05890 [Planctomycetales bacterium]